MAKKGMTLEEKTIHEPLRALYGGYMRVKDVMTEFNFKDRKQAVIWAEGLPQYKINGVTRYATVDVARRICQCRI